jgi:hypothetical protein
VLVGLVSVAVVVCMWVLAWHAAAGGMPLSLRIAMMQPLLLLAHMLHGGVCPHFGSEQYPGCFPCYHIEFQSCLGARVCYGVVGFFLQELVCLDVLFEGPGLQGGSLGLIRWGDCEVL